MLVFREVKWIRSKMNAAIVEIERKKTMLKLDPGIQPNQLNEYTNMLDLNVMMLVRMLELISDKKEDDVVQVDTGDDKVWLMSEIKE